MAYRCKVCGYKFKSTDDDLCPQCFTARDDVKCTDGIGHTHGFDTSKERNSFLEEEELREKIPSVSELSGQAHRAADELSKKYQTYRNDQHKMSGSSRTSGTSGYTRQQRSPYQSSSPNSGALDSFQKRANYSAYSTVMNQNQAKNKKGAQGCLVVFILLFFALPILATVLSSSSVLKKAIEGATNEENGNKAYTIDPPDIDMPSIPDFSSLLDNIYDYDYDNSTFDLDFKQEEFSDPNKRLVYDSCYTYDDAVLREADRFEFLDHSLEDEEIRQYYIDFADPDGNQLDIKDPKIKLSGIDAQGLPVYYYDNDGDEIYLLVVEKVKFYSLNVTYFDEDGNQKDMCFDFRLDDLSSYGR